VEQRSGCPINLTVEVLGDRWSLVVLRDIIFGNFRTYRELHGNSLEGIATTSWRHGSSIWWRQGS
jgi:Predicted transcriptional regulators